MDSVTIIKPGDLEDDLCLNALMYLMFLKKNITRKIKARGCADGRPQQEYIGKEEASSPTVSIYALFSSCAINPIKKIQVMKCDIPGAFLQPDWPSNKPIYLNLTASW